MGIFLWIIVAILLNAYLLIEFPSVYPIILGNIALVFPIFSDKLRQLLYKRFSIILLLLLICILGYFLFNHNLIVNPSFEKPIEPPWGTSSYEEASKEMTRIGGLLFLQSNCDATMDIRSGLANHGRYSWHIKNKTPAAPHSWMSFGQSVKVLNPWKKCRIKFAVKSKKANKQTVVIDYRRDWGDSVEIDEGSYEWRYFTKTVELDNNKEIDFRITTKDEGEVWIDDISFRRVLW